MSCEARVFEVCYVEDNPADVRLLVEAIAEANLPWRLHSFPSLTTAFTALVDEQSLSPDLILLDGGLHLSDSTELLWRLRSTLDLSVPLIVFSGSPPPPSTSSQPWDKWVQKPINWDAYLDTVREMLSALSRQCLTI